ncbi:Probable ketosteroid isomerase-related protein (plasmid) [Neorhizobium galegae bv. officinalis bv. officinalis str. HAMBI 1141]|uniref:Probable ketosteroid isomerase-related protein n=1 Tax=Neorhizobium galegae bv. officinalis bv. officinalis str. HAMBI 1141 TaxID=1028801 RepID=A0A068TIQ7_NEOGA|nr:MULTISPECIES: nuclear transport factor 2 family protein [Neorhizobium]MCJ9669737.1 nuclear transport factor 2 family protein [Neorhizobium sp. SHOUNA12B]MCJ9746061.1 nuclear transport factor 2 family protein [Neorhizobium sp. SHOUNA12A]CDN57941.1 Probable ketosteroid isomerase-related protein [Neorhizobium galegae bv. officinalis bv. officinalis str. HAMBI 1141]
MTENEKIVRAAYETAERQDLEAFINCFTPDGTLTDQSIAVTYQGRDVAKTVAVYAKAFPDMHRELFRMFEVGDTIVVELALQGTHKGPLDLPSGTVQPTGKRMDAPCCDVFQIRDGKIQSFNCYPSGTVVMQQLGLR